MGVEKEITFPGDGLAFPEIGKKVTINYTVFLDEQVEVDSTRILNKPFTFTLGAAEVISGLEDAVPTMSIGERCRLHMTPDVA
jgi:FK506-binding protein 1